MNKVKTLPSAVPFVKWTIRKVPGQINSFLLPAAQDLGNTEQICMLNV